MAIENLETYNDYLTKLEAAADMSILNFKDLIAALQKRHDFFASQGCSLSDHGLTTFYAEPYTDAEIEAIFLKARMKKALTGEETDKFRSAMLYELAVMDARSNWVQQFHVGATRNNNARMFKLLGPDTGYDAIGDAEVATPMARFLSRLDEEGQLAKSIFYNLNPRDNELMVTTIYSFNDGTVPGKMQYGSGWWFLDQIHPIRATSISAASCVTSSDATWKKAYCPQANCRSSDRWWKTSVITMRSVTLIFN